MAKLVEHRNARCADTDEAQVGPRQNNGVVDSSFGRQSFVSERGKSADSTGYSIMRFASLFFVSSIRSCRFVVALLQW